MAGLLSDMVQFNDQFYGGFLDTVVGNIDVFNADSLGTIQMLTDYHIGALIEDAFFTDDITIRDRDPNSVAAVTSDSLGASQVNSVKVYKYNSFSQTLQSLRDQNPSAEVVAEMAFEHGRRMGRKMMENWREAAVSSLVGVFGIAGFQSGSGQLVLDISQTLSGGVFDDTTLMDAMPLFGDQTMRLRAIIMHSDVYWPLVKAASANLATPTTADFAVRNGLPATLGLPIILSSSPSLIDAGAGGDGQDAYYSFVLAEGAVKISESEKIFLNSFIDGSTINSSLQLKTETAYTVGIKGVSYTGSTAGAISNTTLSTASNWTKAYTSKYDLMGIAIKSVAVANDATP